MNACKHLLVNPVPLLTDHKVDLPAQHNQARTMGVADAYTTGFNVWNTALACFRLTWMSLWAGQALHQKWPRVMAIMIRRNRHPQAVIMLTRSHDIASSFRETKSMYNVPSCSSAGAPMGLCKPRLNSSWFRTMYTAQRLRGGQLHMMPRSLLDGMHTSSRRQSVSNAALL